MCDIYVQPIRKRITGANYHLPQAKGTFLSVKAIKNIILFSLCEEIIKPQLKNHIAL